MRTAKELFIGALACFSILLLTSVNSNAQDDTQAKAGAVKSNITCGSIVMDGQTIKYTDKDGREHEIKIPEVGSVIVSPVSLFLYIIPVTNWSPVTSNISTFLIAFIFGFERTFCTVISSARNSSLR